MKRTALLLILCLLNTLLIGPPALAKPQAASGSKAKKAISKKPVKKKAALRRRSGSAARSATNTRTTIARKATSSHRKHLASFAPARSRTSLPTSPPNLGDVSGLGAAADSLGLKSNAALILDQLSSKTLFEKNAHAVLPIASITKLMTAFVVLEAAQDMQEVLTITTDDIDRIKHTSSRLPIGTKLTRAEMLHIALMSSENRAASALGRHYPGGLPAFVEAMNAQAKLLGMSDTRYVEPTGLSSHNVSSPHDLARLVIAAEHHPLIRKYSTYPEHTVDAGRRTLHYRNSNRLIRNSDWDIVLQKTGYISEAGKCLVMQAIIDGRSIVMVFLDAKGKYSRAADANRMRQWLQKVSLPALTQALEENQG